MHRGGFSPFPFAALIAVGFGAAKAGAAEITFNQIRALAVESLRAGDVVYTPPSSKVVGRMLWVKDAGPFADSPDGVSLDYWLADGDLLKAVFLDQLAVEIRRQHLFARSRGQQIMEPYYRRMEAIVAAELALVQQPGGDDDKPRQLDERLRQLGDLLQSGIEACARQMGLGGTFVEPGHDDDTLWLDRAFALDLPRQVQITYGQLKQAAARALGERGVTFDAPKATVHGGTLRVSDVGLRVETMRTLSPLEELLAELVKIDLRRRQLFERPANRAIMEPVYVRMETALRRRLDALRRGNAASVAARRASSSAPVEAPAAGDLLTDENRSSLGRELDATLGQGLEQCARRMGNLQLEYRRRTIETPPAAMPEVRLAAPPDTTIEFVYHTDHKLWSLAGKREEGYPWKRTAAGDRVYLPGGYWFRLTYAGGARDGVYKKVRPNERELRFPAR